MNKKKAQQQFNIGSVFIGLSLFALLRIGGFNFYLGYLVDNSATLPDGINKTEIQSSFGRFDNELGDTSNSINTTKGDSTEQAGFFDYFAVGISSVRTAWDSIGFMADYVNFVRDNTKLGQFLPDEWWSIVLSIFTIVLVLVGISAFWRYNIVK